MARTLMREGEHHFVALSWASTSRRSATTRRSGRLVWTAHHWQHWLARGRFPDHPWSRYLQRSALTLKGLTFAPSGAMVAAATTSLPEVPHGERNWDYRYCWMRDSTFALWGLYALGFDWEADDFFWFIADIAQRDDEVQVMYGVDGERMLSERILDHLSGYDGARPVRVGNAAYTQRQHDVWGAMLQAIHIRLGSWQRLDEPDLAGAAPAGGVGAEVLAGTRPGHLGGTRRAPALHLLQAHVLVGGAARGAGRAGPGRGDAGQDLARGGRRDPGGHPGPRGRRPRRVHPALRDPGAGRLAAAAADDRLPAPGGPAGPGHHPGHRRRAHRGRAGAPVPARGDRRRAARRRGHVHHLLVLAGVGAVRDR